MQVRVYLDKTKLYGIATVGKKYFARVVCRNCLTEFNMDKAFEKEILVKFKADLEVAKIQEKEAKKKKKEQEKLSE
jgi:hypothetical protein